MPTNRPFHMVLSPHDEVIECGGPVIGNHDPFMVVLSEMASIHKAKNKDYGNSFELAAGMLGRPVVEVLLSRMTDKLARACNLVRRNGQAAVKDESLADTLLDLANYAVLAVVAFQKEA